MQKAVVSYPPRWATIGIGSQCTNRCLFCSYHSLDARNGNSKVYNLKYKMTLERFKRQVDMFYAGRVPHVHICAPGEPFLHENILDMIDYVADVYGKASFQSNFNASVMKRGNYMDEIMKRVDRIKYIVTDIHAGEGDLFNGIKRGSDFKNHINVLKTLQRQIKLIGSCILTKENSQSIMPLVKALVDNGIRMQINVVNLFPHMFNDFTSMDNVYKLADKHIEAEIQEVKEYGEKHGLIINLPEAFDDTSNTCNVFWEKVQIWPVEGIDPERYDENLVPHACNAVVLGDINSYGYLFDYDDVMDFWNNDVLVGYRQKVLDGIYPDPQCSACADGVNLVPEETV
jgi:MoaA/NifB/PqqE/SkfB family radical SAM enzyme